MNMKWKSIDLRKRLYLLSAIILIAGLASAALIYWTAMNKESSDSGYEVAGGFIYPNNAENSKKYIHDLQLYGGKAAVLSDQFMRWFAGLWQGQTLAFTVAFISVFISFAVFVAANNAPSGSTSPVRGMNRPGKCE
jgi:hypothetical protein